MRVGRHKTKTSHARASESLPDFKADFNEKSKDLSAMNYLNDLFYNLLPNVKVCYHNPLYVQQIEETYSTKESELFLQFVKTFAQFRKADEFAQSKGVILTNETDFLIAFKLLRQRKIDEQPPVKEKNKNKVLDLLKLKFKQRTFSAKLLAKEFFYNYTLLDKIITLLLLEQEIEFVKETAGQLFYRLHTKSVVHVTYR